MADRFKQGLVFRITKPSVVSNVKQQYNIAPKSEVVSMLHTTFTPVLSSAGKPTMPEPSIPIAMCMSINREQQFDVMGIVCEVSEVLPGGKTSSGQERVRCTCKITDGSKMPGTDQTCDLPSLSSKTNPAAVQRLPCSRNCKRPPSINGMLLSLAWSFTDDGNAAWSFTSSFTFSVVCASKTVKGTRLETEGTHILEEESASVPTPATHVGSMGLAASVADQTRSS